jgi:hypothetical protein
MLRRFGQGAHRPAGVIIGDPSNADRFGWPVDGLGTPTLDWADGDEGTPAQGPALDKEGTPAAGTATPWTLYNGTSVTCTTFAVGEHFDTATTMNPTAGNDMVILGLFKAAQTNTTVIVGTRSGGAGWMLYGAATPAVFFRSEDAVANVVSSATNTPNAYTLAGVTYDASGDQYLYVNGSPGDNDTVSGLGALTGVGVGVNSRAGGTFDEPSCIVRVMVWYGSNLAAIADAAWHLALAKSIVLA